MKNNGSLNRIYRLVWSHVLNSWVAVAESARGSGKGSSRKLVAAALTLSFAWAHAGPQGGAVVTGAGSIANSGTTTTINQSSQNLSLTWQSFNVGKQEAVNFVQPSATAIAVNRIYDTNGSQILGQINANGQVYLINPNGILFGQGAQVNVGALIASTLDLSDASLGSASRAFSGTGTGSIINQGTINATGSGGGGYVALLGNTVINQGIINAPQGSVALGAASATTLTFQGSHLIGMQIDQGVLDSLAENKGLIRADGGMVMMSAGARNELLASVVNNTGVIEARTVENHEGTITLVAGMSAGTVHVAGTLDASATSGGNGGLIETSGANVKVADSANVTTLASAGTTGTWLIDPTNFTISDGSAAQNSSGIGAATLASNLGRTSVSISTAAANTGSELGDININAAVKWDANKLTLTALNDIHINAVMTANNTASLSLQPGSSGNVNVSRNADGKFQGRVDFFKADGTTARTGSDFLTIGANNYTVIASAAELQSMHADTHYAVGNNIDNANAAFASIVNFNSNFDGLGHTISNLAITGGANTGLFGNTTNAKIQNVGLEGGSVSGNAGTGALIGNMISGTVNNSYSTASVNGNAGTGGLVGSMVGAGGSINNSYATGAVKGDAATGGLVGSLAGSGDISNSHATGYVNTTFAGAAGIGGLVGSSAASGNISNSYATGNVTSTGAGTAGTGGLVGSSAASGTISESYATGNVKNTGAGGAGFGGLVGSSAASGNISNSYAMGNVTSSGAGAAATGGLVGSNTSGAIYQSYAVGNVSGGGAGTGGLVGSNTLGTISESFAAGNVTGLGASTGGLVGSNAITGTIHDTYAAGNVNGSGAGTGGLVGHNFGTVSNSYAAGVVAGNPDTLGPLVGSDVAGTVSNSFWKIVDGGAVNMTKNALGGLISMGLTHDQLKTQANFTGPTSANGNNALAWDFNSIWTMPPATASYVYPIFKNLVKQVTVTANDASKTYDAQTYTGAIGGTLSSPLNPAIGTVTYGGNWSNAVNAGTYFITPELTVSNAYLNPYYVINSIAGTLAIAKKTLTATATADSKTYDGSTTANASLTLAGMVGSETLGSSNLATFNSQNVLAANTVTVNAVTLANGTNGGLASNYALGTGQTASATIAAKAVTIAGVSAANKAYDGNTTATVTGSVSGLVSGESLNLTGQFDTKDAGTLKAVTVATADGSNGGIASNYTVTPTAQTATANIERAVLTATATATNKIYDGSNSANASLTLAGMVGTETLGSSNSATFNSQNVLAANTVTVNAATLANGSNGGLASNYTLAAGQTATASIATKDISLANVAATNKTYDGNNTGTATGTVTGLVGSESLNISGQFNSKDAATATSVTIDATTLANGTNGGLASNYSLDVGATVAAGINRAVLSAAATAANKAYDGSTSANASLALNGLVGTETLGSSNSATFNSQNVSEANTVRVNSVTLANGAYGGLASNYTLGTGQTASANITAKAITLAGVSATDKVYDGNATANVSGAVTGLIAGESLTISGQFDNKNTGVGKGVTVSTANGANGLASNYAIAPAAQNVVATIDRLKAVAWVGGPTGNWFDPSNWAGGAVPDLANVANVSIPTGVNVSFNNTSVVLPAQAGTVNVDNINSGGTLSLVAGGLDVATRLASTTLTQSGGTLSGTGNVIVNNFNQTGGSVLTKGNFNVSDAFTQSAPGNIAVGGNVDIAQTTGDLNIARLSGNNIDLTARSGGVGLGDVNAAGTLRITANGNISQTPDGSISSNAGSTITSTNGDITLANLANDEGGTLILTGRNIALADISGPTMVLNASGDSSVVSGGTLLIRGNTNNLTTTTLNGGSTIFGETTLTGNLTTLSAGTASQTGTLRVNGTASAMAAGQDAIANKSLSIIFPSALAVTPSETGTPTPDSLLPLLPRITNPGVNPTVGELTANKSTTSETTENGVSVVTSELDDGSKSLKVVNGGMSKSDREVQTSSPGSSGATGTTIPNTPVLTGG